MDRKRTISRITRQKNRLLQKGASAEDVAKYFGADIVSKPISRLTNEQIKNIDNTYYKRGKVEVVDGSIYPKGYTKNHDITIGNGNYTKNFNNRFTSPLNEMTPSELRKRKSYNEVRAKERYILEAKRLGVDSSIINKMKNLSIEEFNKRVDNSKGLLSFDEVFKNTDMETEDLQSDIYANNRDTLNKNFSKFF